MSDGLHFWSLFSHLGNNFTVFTRVFYNLHFFSLSFKNFHPWRRKWQPTPVYLPGKSHGQRNLAGHSPWGQKKKKKKKYSSYFWLHRVLAVARGNLIAPRRLLSSCGTGAQELPHTGLVAVGGMWDLSSPHFSSFQLLSRVRFFATPWIAAWQASLSITNSQSSPKLLSIESVMPSLLLLLLSCFSRVWLCATP